MPIITDGYVSGVGGYFKVSDNSGPYSISSAGVPTLLNPGAGSTGGDANANNQVIGNTGLGMVTETSPATDTASSGLNGRMQRIAQRLTSLIAQFPATLGIKTSALSLSVAPSSDGVFATTQHVGVTYTDRSGTVTTGGTAQQLMAANASRKGFWIQNQSSADLYINTLTTAVVSQPSMRIAAGVLYECPKFVPLTAISIIGATTGQAFAAREY